MQFNNTIARGTQRLADSAKKFYAAVGARDAADKPAIDAAGAQSAYNEVQKACRK